MGMFYTYSVLRASIIIIYSEGFLFVNKIIFVTQLNDHFEKKRAKKEENVFVDVN